MHIISKAELATLTETHRRVQRRNWALKRGGSVDIYLLSDKHTYAVVADPAKLTIAERNEIAEIFKASSPQAAESVKAEPPAEPINNQPPTSNA